MRDGIEVRMSMESYEEIQYHPALCECVCVCGNVICVCVYVCLPQTV